MLTIQYDRPMNGNGRSVINMQSHDCNMNCNLKDEILSSHIVSNSHGMNYANQCI